MSFIIGTCIGIFILVSCLALIGEPVTSFTVSFILTVAATTFVEIKDFF